MNRPIRPNSNPPTIQYELIGFWIFILILIPTVQIKITVFLIGVSIFLIRRWQFVLFNFKSWIFGFNEWLLKKENVEMRPIELKVLAAENRLTYIEKDDRRSEMIFSLIDSTKFLKAPLNNLIIGEVKNGSYFFFDYQHRMFPLKGQTRGLSKKYFSTGIGIKSNHKKAPDFLIVNRLVAGRLQLRQDEFSSPKYIGYLHELPNENFPHGLSPDHFVCLCKKDDQVRVSRFLKEHSSLGNLTGDNSLQLISFKQELAVAFFNKTLHTDGANFQEQIHFALDLLSFGGDGTEIS